MGEGEEEIPVIADSNILFRFLLKSRKIRNLLYSRKLLVYTPDWAIYELGKYLEYLRGKLVKKGFSPLLLEFLEISSHKVCRFEMSPEHI